LAEGTAFDGKGAACSALSLAVGFTASPARFGSLFAGADAGPSPCGATWTDTCP
jgi:hypothetical protein